jgi:SPP1 family predicted phage head-tail adaptor
MKKRMIQAGNYRYPATIQKRNMGQNSYGETIQDWVDVMTVRVNVAPLYGREFFDKESVNSELTHKITMRYVRNIVTPDMRILYDGRTFSISSIIDYQEQHRELQMVCKELVSNE